MDNKLSKDHIPELVRKQFPDYKDISIDSLLGMTNLTFRVSCLGHKTLIFRIFLGDLDRKTENLIVAELSKAKIAPQCYFMCEKYRIEEFFQNSYHPTPKEIEESSQIQKIILEKLYGFHQLQLPQFVPRTLLVDKLFSKENKEKLINLKCPVANDQDEFSILKKDVSTLWDQVREWFFNSFQSSQEKIKFCHNDLNNLNILLRDKGETKECSLIDFEYGAYNYIAYDIANTFNESSYFYLNEKPGFRVERTYKMEEISKICSLYPGKYEGMDQDVIIMLVVVNVYWSIWCLETHKEINSESVSVFEALKHCRSRIDLAHHYLKENGFSFSS